MKRKKEKKKEKRKKDNYLFLINEWRQSGGELANDQGQKESKDNGKIGEKTNSEG